jgi:hypothetical protein
MPSLLWKATLGRQLGSNSGRPAVTAVVAEQRVCIHIPRRGVWRVGGGGGHSSRLYKGASTGDRELPVHSRGVGLAVAMETALFVVISCLLLHWADQSTIRKSAST